MDDESYTPNNNARFSPKVALRNGEIADPNAASPLDLAMANEERQTAGTASPDEVVTDPQRWRTRAVSGTDATPPNFTISEHVESPNGTTAVVAGDLKRVLRNEVQHIDHREAARNGRVHLKPNGGNKQVR